MKTSEPKQTKEEILAKYEAESADRLMDQLDYYERVIFPAMQEYAEAFHKEKLRDELIHFASQRNEQAWICPRCQKVHNWMVQSCDCPPNTITVTTYDTRPNPQDVNPYDLNRARRKRKY